MKNTFKTLLMSFGMVSMFATMPVSAQTHRAVAEIPFSFVVSGQTLPAGKYDVSQFNNGIPVFTVRGAHNAAITQLSAEEAGQPNHPSVTFKKVGGDWVLVKITPPGSLAAYSLPEDHLNKKYAIAALVSIKLK